MRPYWKVCHLDLARIFFNYVTWWLFETKNWHWNSDPNFSRIAQSSDFIRILEIIHWKVRHLNLARIFFDCMTWSSPFSWFFFIQQLYSYYSHHSLELAPHRDLKLRNSFVNCTKYSFWLRIWTRYSTLISENLKPEEI